MGNVKSCQKYYRLAIENYCQYSECRIDGWMDQLSHEMLRKIDCEILMCHGLIKFGMNEVIYIHNIILFLITAHYCCDLV